MRDILNVVLAEIGLGNAKGRVEENPGVLPQLILVVSLNGPKPDRPSCIYEAVTEDCPRWERVDTVATLLKGSDSGRQGIQLLIVLQYFVILLFQSDVVRRYIGSVAVDLLREKVEAGVKGLNNMVRILFQGFEQELGGDDRDG